MPQVRNGDELEYWPEVFKTYPIRDLPFWGKKQKQKAKQEFRAVSHPILLP